MSKKKKILIIGQTPPGTFTGLNGQTIVGDANGAWVVTANGTNQSITLTPSGTGGVRLPDGSVSAPILGFVSQTSLGFYKATTSVIGISGGFLVASTNTLRFGATANATIGVSADTTAGDLVFTGTTTGQFKFSGTGVLKGDNGNTTIDIGGNVMSLNGNSGVNLKYGGTTLLTVGGGTSTVSGGAQNMVIQSGTGNSRTMALQTTTSGGVATDAIVIGDTQLITKYGNITTAGNGVVSVQAAGRVTAQVAANASVATYTVGASDASFVVSANVNVTTATAHNFTVTCTYTDETNTSRTLTLAFTQLTGSTLLTAITNITGAGPYEAVPFHIRCKASTAITFATIGTFTTVTYNAEGVVTKLA